MFVDVPGHVRAHRAKISKKNTRPELRVRSHLHRLGYRFRLHAKELPGTPDIVLPRYRIVVFAHGCFWHRHSCRLGKRVPKNRAIVRRSFSDSSIAIATSVFSAS